MYYVYIHTNKINGKKYCGYTKNIEERWRCNGICYRPPKGKENTRPFWNAIVKYGWDNFESEVILETKDKQKAIQCEIDTIKNLNLRDKNYGYNVALGGDGGVIYLEHPKGMLGKPQTEYNNECCRKRFIENNPMHNGVVWGETHSHPKGFKNKEHSSDSKRKISETLKEKWESGYFYESNEDRKIKISQSLKGVPKSEEHKKKLSESRKSKGIAKGGKNPSAKKVKLTYPDGEFEIFDCTKDFKDKFGTSQTTFTKMIESTEPYQLPKGLSQKTKDKLIKLVGCSLKYI